jgi:DNA-binding MarR family transcriptional regulator
MMAEALELPLTPYAGTSGWSGSTTSQDRAIQEDLNGTTKGRQSLTLRVINASKTYGMTWKELADETGWHHGQASGVLSVLHKEGLIARLTERRGKCAVYVGLNSVNGRKTSEQKIKSCKHCGGAL